MTPSRIQKVSGGSPEKLRKAATDTRTAIKRSTKKGTPDKAGHRLRPG